MIGDAEFMAEGYRRYGKTWRAMLELRPMLEGERVVFWWGLRTARWWRSLWSGLRFER